MTVRGVGHSHPPAQLKGQEIAHQRLVSIIVDEGPFLRFGRSVENTLLLVELDAIGLLGEAA